jgi:HSP20 family protein
MIQVTSISEPLRPEYYKPDELQFIENDPHHWRLSVRSTIWRPPTDVYETEDAIIIRVEIAGMKEEDFTIELDSRLISIRGIRSDVPERRAYHQMEIRFGEFSCELDLPSPVIIEEVKAAYKDGFLRVVLPKIRARHIPID